MKKSVLYLFILTSLTIQFSCKKKKAEPESPQPITPVGPAPKKTDTIKPLSYFPAYPGSYWKYSDNTTFTTAPTYKKDAYEIRFMGDQTFKSDSVFVPFYEGFAIWGYKKHDESAVLTSLSPTQPFVRIISDSLPLNGSWGVRSTNHEFHSAKIIAKDSTITISGKNYYPTIVVSYYWYHDSHGPFPEGRKYFTKDIGLIKSEVLNMSGAVTAEAHLVDYFINK